jgi:2,4-dienoyl-CoA reductase-like NADH-dependent reductase (Old Yellow Enzyme family)
MNVLFTPAKIGTIEIKNRFVRSATNDRMVTRGGKVTDELVDCYRVLARGEIGLIITGHAYISALGQGSVRQLGVYDDNLIAGLRLITDAVHEMDGKVAIQITHAGRQTQKEIINETPVAPSAIPYGLQKVVPRELSDGEIGQIIEDFAGAASRAQEAGFDAVQLHGAHGYLITQFLSPFSNKRTDRWGGDEERRFRFLHEVNKSVREKVGPDFPVFIKLAMKDFVEGGLDVSTSISIARRLSELGIDAIETSGGFSSGMENIRRDVLPGKGEAYFRAEASRLKKNVDVPVILVGGLRSLSTMESIIEGGDADFVSLSRPFIREPDLVLKLKSGADRASCVSCSKCSISREPVLRCLAMDKA